MSFFGNISQPVFGQNQQTQQMQQPAFGAQQTGFMGAGQPVGGGYQAVQTSSGADKFDQEVQLQSQDTLSVLKFSPNITYQNVYGHLGQLLAGAAWCGSVMIWKVLYNPQQEPRPQVQPMTFQNVGAPVLGMCWQVDAAALLLACADNTIKKWDLNSNQVSVIGQHNAPVKDVVNILLPTNNMSVVITGGWDSRVKFWSWSAPNMLNCVSEIYVAMPVHYMSCTYPILVTAHQQRLLHVWNLEEAFKLNNFNPSDVIESPLKFATSSVQCFADGKGFCIGSIEGRCCVRYYDLTLQDKGDSKQFCFKCHRKENPDKSAVVSSVNGFCFNKKYNTFYSYGGDGTYVSWNKDARAKYRASEAFSGAIVCADQTEEGQLFAYAVGYDWSRGFEGQKEFQYQNKLYIRTPDIQEVWRNK